MAIFENADGATPIDDISELIPTHITTKADLNEWEAANILKATRKYLGSKRKNEIDVTWIKKVHKDMFGETWKWSGEFRKKNFNIGINWQNISEQIKILVDDISYWKTLKNGIEVFEQSVRIHHRLVKIHPFVNGNGRHARLVSDIFLFNHGQPLPTLPSEKLIKETNIRNDYIKALKDADNGDFNRLIKFTKDLLP